MLLSLTSHRMFEPATCNVENLGDTSTDTFKVLRNRIGDLTMADSYPGSSVAAVQLRWPAWCCMLITTSVQQSRVLLTPLRTSCSFCSHWDCSEPTCLLWVKILSRQLMCASSKKYSSLQSKRYWSVIDDWLAMHWTFCRSHQMKARAIEDAEEAIQAQIRK